MSDSISIPAPSSVYQQASTLCSSMVSRWESTATRIRSRLAASKTASTLSPLWYRIVILIAFFPPAFEVIMQRQVGYIHCSLWLWIWSTTGHHPSESSLPLAVGTRRDRRRRAGNQPHRGMPFFGVRWRTAVASGKIGHGQLWPSPQPNNDDHFRRRAVPTRTHWLTSALLRSTVK